MGIFKSVESCRTLGINVDNHYRINKLGLVYE